MKAVLPSCLLLIAGLAAAQERCDAPYPNVYCNTTEILKFQSSDCKSFHVFISRGSDEPYPGRLGNLTSQICDGIGGTDKCSYEDIEYPAKSTAWGEDEWCKSASKGTEAGQKQMKDYSDKCPKSKLILLGYSQGAAVAQDILGGGGGPVFKCEQDENPALDATSAPGKNVIAAVTFGSVTRSKGQNFTIGNTKDYDGTRARTPSQLKALQAYSGVLLDYCHVGDPICAPQSSPIDVFNHLDYFLQHNADVKKWVVGMAKASDGDVSAKPSKPDGADTGGASTTSSAPASSASSGSATSSPAEASASPTDGSEALPAQSGNPDAASAAGRGVATAAVGSVVGLVLAVAVLL